MRGWRQVLALVAVVQVVACALAHGTTVSHDLAGVSFCVDDASVAVSFERDPTGVVADLVHERIDRAIRRTFDAAAVPWRRQERCPEGRSYVEATLHVREAAWFAPRASAYDVTVRVGPRRAFTGGARADPPDGFDFFAAEVFDEVAVGVPAFVFLPRYVEAGLRDLSVSWWEDRADAATAGVPRWVPFLGALVALVVAVTVAVVLRVLRRRGRWSTKQAPGHSQV
ncbi:MAG: hypothetical protein H0U69_12340 [Trueperaceae bacterium]|nr:hypothetical protein [Trueperaceae bacterium]